MTFIIIDVEQGSPEWHALRKEKIGASSTPAILGLCPWTKAKTLWSQLLGVIPQKETTPAMSRGTTLEPLARECFNQSTGFDMKPAVVVSIEHPWMMASLDGMNLEKEILLEIKCPGIKTINMAMEGKIPLNYQVQIQHQFAVTGFDQGYYYCFDGDQGIAISINRDNEMIDRIINEGYRFYQSLISLEPLEEWVR